MADSRSYPVDFVPGPSSADDLNKLPRGNIAGKERASNQSNIDGIDAVITFDFTIPEDGRRQRFTAGVMMRSETSGGVQARIEVNGTQIQRKNQISLGGSASVSWEFSKDKQLDAGDYTARLMCGRSGDGDNLVTALADGEDGDFGVNYLYIDDVGPAY